MIVAIVMQYHPADMVGGAELQASYIAEILALRGDVVVYVSTEPGTCRSALLPATEDLGGVHVIRAATASASATAEGVEGELRQLRPDVCYVRSFPLMADTLASCDRLGIPAIAHLSSDADARARPKILSPGQLRPSYLRQHARQYRAVLNKARIIACQSQTQRTSMASQPGLAARRCVIVPNLWPDTCAPLAEMDSVVWVGNLKRVKRPKAFVDLARHLQGGCCRFEMIGRSAPRYESMLHAAERIDGFKYLGSLEVAEAGRHIAAARLLVNTSWYEGFPNTYLQAFAAGRPVVSLGVDPDGVLANQRIGIVCTSERQLTEEVAGLLADDDRRREFGRRARDYFLQRHSFAAAKSAYYRLFDDAAAERRS